MISIWKSFNCNNLYTWSHCHGSLHIECTFKTITLTLYKTSRCQEVGAQPHTQCSSISVLDCDFGYQAKRKSINKSISQSVLLKPKKQTSLTTNSAFSPFSDILGHYLSWKSPLIEGTLISHQGVDVTPYKAAPSPVLNTCRCFVHALSLYISQEPWSWFWLL